MAGRPDMIVQFAQYLYQKVGHGAKDIGIDVTVSLIRIFYFAINKTLSLLQLSILERLKFW